VRVEELYCLSRYHLMNLRAINGAIISTGFRKFSSTLFITSIQEYFVSDGPGIMVNLALTAYLRRILHYPSPEPKCPLRQQSGK
jgi:hypothetical protein